MSVNRRSFLRGSIATAVAGVMANFGMFGQAMSAWKDKSFQSKSVADALESMVGVRDMTASDKIKLKVPEIAENGAVVPVKISTSLPDVESITILVAKNASPMVASFKMSPLSEGYVSTRIKMGQSSDVIAVVKSGGKLYSTQKVVKVTIGGCGG
jgi:sulfur-oxidizing protein SoxY